jgi:hypothetical protein
MMMEFITAITLTILDFETAPLHRRPPKLGACGFTKQPLLARF